MNRSLTSRSTALLLVGILGLAIGAGRASADILIDDFSGTAAPASPTVNSGPAPAYYSGTSGNPSYWSMIFSPLTSSAVNTSVNEPAGIPGVLSGWGRTINVLAPDASAAFFVEASVDSVLAVNTGAATDTTMTYNGGTPTSTPQDFTGTTGFNFSFTSIDHDPVPILITIEDSTGKTETATGSTTFTGSGVVTIPVSSFSNAPGFDLGSVTEFQASIDGSGIQDLNYRLGAITADPPLVTPEPGPLALLAVSVIALAGYGLRRRAALVQQGDDRPILSFPSRSSRPASAARRAA